MHFCEVCQKKFRTKRNLETHYLCESHKRRADTSTTLYTCHCGKPFFHKPNLYRHKNVCEVPVPVHVPVPQVEVQEVQEVTFTDRVEQLEVKLEKYELEREQYEKERQEMRAQIALLLEAHASEGNTHTSGNHTNNIENQTNNNIENQTNNTINIHINAFGKENTDYLDDQAIVECIDRIFNSVPAILKRIHFDPDHPENHNIKITNKKLPYASVMGDNRTWKTVNKKDAIESMVAKGYNFLDEKYADTKGRLSKRRQQHFEGFQDKFADEDKEMHKQLMTNVELLVLNQGKD